MPKIPVALQLYTIRDACNEDFVGALKSVSDIGYAGVELTGDGGLPHKELSSLLADLNLQVAGCHVSLANLENELNIALDMNEAVGNRRIVCPWLPPERRINEDDYKALAASLSEIGSRCKERGFQLYYHHHDFEFIRFNGSYAIDTLFESVSDNLLRAELDTYWIEVAGEKASEFIQKYSGKVDLVHLKDRLEFRDPPFAEVGEGTLDFPQIFRACDDAEIDWYIVEQDRCPANPLESARRSFRNLKMWGKA